jgi:hypothetical protein
MKATRICAGCYDYRGYAIEKTPEGEWTIRDLADAFPCDVADTLTEAKKMVDSYNDR